MKIKAKKSLGQNFLIDQNIAKKIVNTVKINENDSIFEIGPGTGSLSAHLINKNPKNFFAIEKDTNLTALLNEKFKNKINIINKDVLKFNIEKTTKDKLIVFGNLPYNISTQILVNWITKNKGNFFF